MNGNESTEEGLERIRTRLLDLTNRNRLLNFRHTNASSLRVVNADLDETFRRLLDGGKLVFLPVPEPDIYATDLVPEGADLRRGTAQPKVTAADYAEELGWETSYDLEGHSYDAERSGLLPVLHYLEGLETVTRKIGSAAKTAIEESGTNMLYLILGFLEWYEADDSQQPRYAPLLTVPVTIDRSSGKGKGFECSIEYSGEDFATNLSLVEKMRRDFALEIPNIEDEDTPERYFDRFSQVLNQKRRWRIRRQITLSLLSFGKLLMYLDLDPKPWIAKHKLVKELFEGNKSSDITRAEEFAIDDPGLKQEVPPLILDADSSQHSALIHALRGQNLVIEGPPGTGKSQTITNLIAAALAKEKTVLFVAEKLAALEVVRRRLDEAGLGYFCLELHSHKTKKHALLNDLDGRLKAQGSFREPRELEQHLAVVEEKKQLLTQYARLINKPLEPFHATIFEILWARDRFYRELPFKRELAGQVLNVLRFTRAEYAQKEQFLSVYARHLSAVLDICSGLGEHPWGWIVKALTFEEEEQVVDRLGSLSRILKEAEECRQNLLRRVDIALEESINGIRKAREFLVALPGPSDRLNQYLLESCRDVRNRAMLRDFALDVEGSTSALRVLKGATAHHESLLRSDVTVGLAGAFETIRALTVQKCTCSQLRDLFEVRKAAEMSLSEAENCFAILQAFLGCEADFDEPGVESVLNCLRLIEDAPLEVLHLRSTSLETDNAGQIVGDAAEEARGLRARHEELSRSFDLSFAMGMANPSQLAEHATVLEEAGVLQVWFGRAYRRAKRTHRRIALTGAKASRDAMARDLRALADHCNRRSLFERNTLYREILGPHFVGVDSRWDELRSLANWYEEVFTLLPEHNQRTAAVRDLVLKSRTERLRALRGNLDSHARNRAVLERLKSAIPQVIEALSFTLPASHPIRELLQQVRTANAQLGETVKALGTAGLHDETPVCSIPDLLAAADRYRTSLARVSTNDSVRQFLGTQFKDVETDVVPIKLAVAFAESLDQGNLPRKAVDCELSARLRSSSESDGWMSGPDVFRQQGVHVVADSVAEVVAAGAYPIEASDQAVAAVGR